MQNNSARKRYFTHYKATINTSNFIIIIIFLFSFCLVIGWLGWIVVLFTMMINVWLLGTYIEEWSFVMFY